MADVTHLPQDYDDPPGSVVQALTRMLALSQAEPQKAAVIVLLGEDDIITVSFFGDSRLVLKGALVHALQTV